MCEAKTHLFSCVVCPGYILFPASLPDHEAPTPHLFTTHGLKTPQWHFFLHGRVAFAGVDTRVEMVESFVPGPEIRAPDLSHIRAQSALLLPVIKYRVGDSAVVSGVCPRSCHYSCFLPSSLPVLHVDFPQRLAAGAALVHMDARCSRS